MCAALREDSCWSLETQFLNGWKDSSKCLTCCVKFIAEVRQGLEEFFTASEFRTVFHNQACTREQLQCLITNFGITGNVKAQHSVFPGASMGFTELGHWRFFPGPVREPHRSPPSEQQPVFLQDSERQGTDRCPRKLSSVGEERVFPALSALGTTVQQPTPTPCGQPADTPSLMDKFLSTGRHADVHSTDIRRWAVAGCSKGLTLTCQDVRGQSQPSAACQLLRSTESILPLFPLALACSCFQMSKWGTAWPLASRGGRGAALAVCPGKKNTTLR